MPQRTKSSTNSRSCEGKWRKKIRSYYCLKGKTEVVSIKYPFLVFSLGRKWRILQHFFLNRGSAGHNYDSRGELQARFRETNEGSPVTAIITFLIFSSRVLLLPLCGSGGWGDTKRTGVNKLLELGWKRTKENSLLLFTATPQNFARKNWTVCVSLVGGWL